MSRYETRQIFEDAKQIISEPYRFCVGSWERNGQYCLGGALMKATGVDGQMRKFDVRNLPKKEANIVTAISIGMGYPDFTTASDAGLDVAVEVLNKAIKFTDAAFAD